MLYGCIAWVVSGTKVMLNMLVHYGGFHLYEIDPIFLKCNIFYKLSIHSLVYHPIFVSQSKKD